MNKLKLGAGELLQRNELKTVIGGNPTGPCDSCTVLCHRHDNGMLGGGMCPSDVGGTSCHNYCCTPGQATYWC